MVAHSGHLARSLRLLPSLLVAGALLLPSTVRGWPFRLDGTEHEADRGYAVAVDANGDVFVGGSVDDEEHSQDGVVVKLGGATGAPIWRYNLRGDIKVLYDELKDLTLDAAGDVYLTGTATVSFTALTVARLDGVTGAEKWRTDVDGAGSASYDTGQAIALDPNGDVLAAGGIQDSEEFIDADMAVVKLSAADGSEMWRATIAGTALRGDYAYAVRSTATGDAVVGGIVWRDGGSVDIPSMVVAKFSGADGHELWRWSKEGTYTTFPYGYVQDLVVDAAGEVYVTGFLTNESTGEDMVVAKLSGVDGSEEWVVNGVAAGNFGDHGVAIALDAAGDVVTGGSVYNGSWYNFMALKFAGATGTELWRREVPTTLFGCCGDVASSVAVDGTQDVIAAGASSGALTIAKLAGSDGDILWRQDYLTYPPFYSIALDLALDAAGNPAAVGYAQESLFEGEPDIFAVKLLGTTGAIVSCGNSVLDPGEQCDDGNLTNGDGCDSRCLGEVPVECGNGIVDPGEFCDDGNATPGDGCEANCRFTICNGGTLLANAKLSARVGGVPSDDSLIISGDLVFGVGTPASVDPATTGAQLLVEDLGAAQTSWYELTRATNPLPAFGNTCDPSTDRWKNRATVDTYKNKSGRLPGFCIAQSARGLRTAKFTDRRTSQSAVKVKTKSQGWSLGAPIGPLRITVVLGAGEAESVGGACGSYTFDPAECTITSDRVLCR